MTAAVRRGDYIKTYTAKQFYVLDPRPEDFSINDIVHSAANLCRFNGHCATFYSVAEHQILCSYLVPPELALLGLLHDASETVLQDLPRPIKNMPEFQFFRDVEGVLDACLAQRFRLPYPFPPALKQADHLALVLEIDQLMGATREDPHWEVYRQLHPGTLPNITLRCYRSGDAKLPFLRRYRELCGLPGHFTDHLDYYHRYFAGLTPIETPYRQLQLPLLPEHAVYEDDGDPD